MAGPRHPEEAGYDTHEEVAADFFDELPEPSTAAAPPEVCSCGHARKLHDRGEGPCDGKTPAGPGRISICRCRQFT